MKIFIPKQELKVDAENKYPQVKFKFRETETGPDLDGTIYGSSDKPVVLATRVKTLQAAIGGSLEIESKDDKGQYGYNIKLPKQGFGGGGGGYSARPIVTITYENAIKFVETVFNDVLGIVQRAAGAQSTPVDLEAFAIAERVAVGMLIGVGEGKIQLPFAADTNASANKKSSYDVACDALQALKDNKADNTAIDKFTANVKASANLTSEQKQQLQVEAVKLKGE